MLAGPNAFACSRNRRAYARSSQLLFVCATAADSDKGVLACESVCAIRYIRVVCVSYGIDGFQFLCARMSANQQHDD